jgi:hypothetical protein
VTCWGTAADEVLNPPLFDAEDVLNCNINLDGNAACADSTGTQVATFNNGPYENIHVSGDFDNKFACAVTQRHFETTSV